MRSTLTVWCLVVLSSISAWAHEIQTTQVDVSCPSGGSFVLWIEGTEGTCKETSSGVYECWETGYDYARASCTNLCEETHVQNVAGCIDKRGGPPVEV
ncbi:MAG TPA: hypothetical protein VKA63_02820, partial [Candidatus Krumholzibacteria bacterium]|nr:hypothetical protein [Candidatus Krumholzibacteria bacterium]